MVDVIEVISEKYDCNDDPARVIREIFKQEIIDLDEVAREDGLTGLESQLGKFSVRWGGSSFTLKGKNQSYLLGPEEELKEEVELIVENMVEEGVISNQMMLDAWRSGQSKDDFIKQVIRETGLGQLLGSRDGNYNEFHDKDTNTLWIWMRN